jgi:hypothetical protein
MHRLVITGILLLSKDTLVNKYTPDDLKKAATGLAYLRKLGRRDLKINYPEVEVK